MLLRLVIRQTRQVYTIQLRGLPKVSLNGPGTNFRANPFDKLGNKNYLVNRPWWPSGLEHASNSSRRSLEAQV